MLYCVRQVRRILRRLLLKLAFSSGNSGVVVVSPGLLAFRQSSFTGISGNQTKTGAD
jgi:hypothetical protein